MTRSSPLTASTALALMLAACPALGQINVSSTATETADPLTPKVVETPPPQAPGAPAPSSLASQQVQHPAVAVLLKRLVENPTQKGAAREDRDALAQFYAENGSHLLWVTDETPTAKSRAALAELARAIDYGLSSKDAYRVELPERLATDDARAEFEMSLSLALLNYARHARGGRADPSAISRMIDMRPRPFEARSVIAALAASDDPAATLRAFHPQHDGFQRLQKALVSVRDSKVSADVVQRIEVNLERWRWMPDDLGAFHVRNNIPEQITRVYKDGQVVLTEKIVVGKTSSPTPVMSADMQFVIFHPSWGVPDGIKNNEVGPMLRRASARNQEWFGEGNNVSRALGRHQFKVSQNGREINPDSIDWTKADVRQFHFSQPPSAQNVLGVVKFRFPNKYDVYMHDTSERHLFGSSVRAFSHGCMRVQNPIHLAEVILAHDKGWSADKVRSFVPGGRSSDITLATPVPVHLTYFTATVDDNGTLKSHGDLYGMDSRVASALAGKPVTLASVKVEGGPVAPQPKRIARTSKQPVAEAWNPFKNW